MSSRLQPLERPSFAHLLSAAYFVVGLATALVHEPWRDEAQAWLTARDLGLSEIFSHMGYGGSPALWHLLLVPLAKSGLPILSQQLLQLVVSTATIYLVARRSPLSQPLCVLFAAGYFMGFEYLVISRSYSLGILLVFTISAMDSRRIERPLTYGLLVCLLANTSAHFLLLAAVLGAAYLRDLLVARRLDRRRVAALALMVAAGIAGALQSWPAEDFVLQGYATTWLSPFEAVAGAFYPAPRFRGGFIIALSLLTLGLNLLAIGRRSRRAVAIVAAALLAFGYIFASTHSGALRHQGLILIVLLAGWWIAAAERDPDDEGAARLSHRAAGLEGLALSLLAVSLLMSVDFGYHMHRNDHRFAFSGGPDMGLYIADNPIDGPIAAHDSALAIAMLPELPDRRIWQVERGAWGTFGTFDREYAEGRERDERWMLARVVEEFGWEGRPWLLLSYRLQDSRGFGYAEVFGVYEQIFGARDETLYLYRPRAGAPRPGFLTVPEALP